MLISEKGMSSSEAGGREKSAELDGAAPAGTNGATAVPPPSFPAVEELDGLRDHFDLDARLADMSCESHDDQSAGPSTPIGKEKCKDW